MTELSLPRSRRFSGSSFSLFRTEVAQLSALSRGAHLFQFAPNVTLGRKVKLNLTTPFARNAKKRNRSKTGFRAKRESKTALLKTAVCSLRKHVFCPNCVSGIPPNHPKPGGSGRAESAFSRVRNRAQFELPNRLPGPWKPPSKPPSREGGSEGAETAFWRFPRVCLGKRLNGLSERTFISEIYL